MGELSQEYYRCLTAAKHHHATSKTYSGKFLRPHAPFIKEIIDRLGCKSVLDYGCGKGSQYTWRNADATGSIPVGMTIEEFWGVPVTKFDPAYPPYAAEPKGPFDLVICTHVLGSIPVQDLAEIVDRLYALSRKALYVAEKIGEPKKLVFQGTRAVQFAEQPTAEYWAKALTRKQAIIEIEVHLATRERTDAGVIVKRVQL